MMMMMMMKNTEMKKRSDWISNCNDEISITRSKDALYAIFTDDYYWSWNCFRLYPHMKYVNAISLQINSNGKFQIRFVDYEHVWHRRKMHQVDRRIFFFYFMLLNNLFSCNQMIQDIFCMNWFMVCTNEIR